MSIYGVSLWRFVLGVIASEAIPILLLVLAMVFVGAAIGGKPSQETAAAWGGWIGPPGGLLATALMAWLLARGATGPVQFGIALGVAVAFLDLGLTLLGTRGEPFKLLYAISALGRLAGAWLGGWLAASSALPGA